jgi:predicted RNase H-like HicB family nuclease
MVVTNAAVATKRVSVIIRRDLLPPNDPLQPRRLASCSRPAASAASGCWAAACPLCYCTSVSLSFRIELELEDDGRWIAEVPDLAGVLCYGATRDEAIARVQALALRVLAERLDHAEAPAEFLNVSFLAA